MKVLWMKLFLKNNKQTSLVTEIWPRNVHWKTRKWKAKTLRCCSREDCQGANRARRGRRSHPATYAFTPSSHVGSCTSHSLFANPSSPLYSAMDGRIALSSHGFIQPGTDFQEHLIQLFNFQHHPIVLNGLHQRESRRNRKVRTDPYGQGFLRMLKLMMHFKLSQINNNEVSLKQKYFQHLKFTSPICPFHNYNCTYKRGTYPHTAQITPSIGCLIHEVL